jgi:glycosyltransferase involved in cell wall biosynthesis
MASLEINNMPYFSIIIPVYKTEAFLEKCLQSVKDQIFKDFECIIIDDGSPGIDKRPKTEQELLETHADFEIEAIFKYVCDSDARFRLIHQTNRGLGPTKNRGISEAKGQRLVVLDSDDFLEVDYLEKVYNSLKEKPNNVIIHGLLKTLSDGKYDTFASSQRFLPSVNNLENLLVFPTWSVTPINYFWPLELIRKHNIQYRFKNKGEDTAFVIDNIIANFKEYGQLTFKPVEIYYIYRQFDEQMTKSDGFEVELFDHTTSFMNQILPELAKIGRKYEVLGRLFVLRFSMYRERLHSQNKIKRLILNLLAKSLTILAILIAGTRKS